MLNNSQTNNDLDIIHVPSFLSKGDADEFFKKLQENIFLNGQMNTDAKVLAMPRLIKWFGDKAYAYASIHHPAEEIPPYISKWMNQLNDFLYEKQIDSSMNSVLINYYRDGKDKINWHSDDESQIGSEPVIASLSLGDSRIFKFKHKVNKEQIDIELKSGDLIIMKGKTQELWQHAILPENNKKERINLTFRNTKFEPVKNLKGF